MDSEKFAHEIWTVKYLWEATSSLKKTDHIHNAIKSNLLTRCRTQSEHKLKLPLSGFGTQVRCSFCSVAWRDDNNYKMALKRKVTLPKKIRKKYKQIEKNKKGLKTEKELKRAKQILYGRCLMITCGFCKKTTKTILYREKAKSETPICVATPKSINNKTASAASIKNNQNSQPTTPNLKSSKIGKRKLENEFYNSSNASLKNFSSPPANSPKSLDSSVKKKRQRDRFAGLCKIACAKSAQGSTPAKNNNPLNLLLRPQNLSR